MSMCLYVDAISFEPLKLGTSFSHLQYPDTSAYQGPVWVSRSLGQVTVKYIPIIELKGAGDLKVKVTQYQDQMLKYLF